MSRGGGASGSKHLRVSSQTLDQDPAQTRGLGSDQFTKSRMKTLIFLLPVLTLLSVPVSAAAGCGPCDPAQCAPLPAEGCAAGSMQDACGCCSVCAAAEGELCGGRRAAARRCGPGLECVKSAEDKKSKLGVCVCKANYEVCGSDGVTYKSGCALKSASQAAETKGNEPISVQNKGRCASGEIETGEMMIDR